MNPNSNSLCSLTRTTHITQHDSHAANPDGHNEDDEAVQSEEAESEIRDGKVSTNRIRSLGTKFERTHWWLSLTPRLGDSSISDSTQPSNTVQEELPEQLEIFIGTMKLISDPVDNIAGAFLNLGELCTLFRRLNKMVRLSSDRPRRLLSKDQRNGKLRLGKCPYFPQLESFVRSNWKGLQTVLATSSGFYFFRFQTRMAMEVVIEGGPWLFQGQPIILQFWEQVMSLRRQKHTKISVWIRLKHLPMEYWTDEGLSTVASGIGTPLYTDGITKDCSRLYFARVCVMLDYSSALPRHLIVISPILRDGKEDPKREFEYEWLPQRCKQCCSLGHIAPTCPENTKKTHAPPITVFVKKQSAQSVPVQPELRDELKTGVANPEFILVPKTKSVPSTHLACSDKIEDGQASTANPKGKEIIIFNSYGVLNLDSTNDTAVDLDAVNLLLGPNIRSPSLEAP
ncbi:UNVERIFIED_CONTAM: hypothetical protein Sradi_5539400 [Sesamum radiatum]|uniref:DUF4283 domain-containing protein n=1 Tax=Sesamum radiatum TaxID=300843 RepID=A0AAW2LDL0_SESRA